MIRGKKEIARIAAIVYLVAFVFFVWGIAAGHYKIFPWKLLHSVYTEVKVYLTFSDGPEKTLKDKIVLHPQEYPAKYDFSGFKLRDPDFRDQGYLLISRYSKKHNQVIIQLFDIDERRVLHTWVPPLTEIFEQTPEFNQGENTSDRYRAQHPLLLKDGDIVFTSGEGPMVRMNACGNLVWIINRHFHHSLELDHNGNIVSPIVTNRSKSHSAIPIRDDGFAIVSLDGHIIEEYSLTDILLKNRYRGLIYGVGKFETDRTHLNDAQPILWNSPSASIGDIALSSRHLSTVALFQPASGNIAWLKTGPWLNQHDINHLRDGRFSIFGNDIIRREKGPPVWAAKGKSEIYIYNPLNNEVARPYSDKIAEIGMATPTSGRSKILSNGDVYIEESDYCRLLRISPDKVRWEYVNSLTPETVGAVHWSRYVPGNKLDLSWKENLICR